MTRGGRVAGMAPVDDEPRGRTDLDFHVSLVTQQDLDDLQMTVLTCCLQGRVSGKDTVDVGIDSLQDLFDFLRVSISCCFHQFLVDVSSHMSLEQLLQQRAQVLCN